MQKISRFSLSSALVALAFALFAPRPAFAQTFVVGSDTQFATIDPTSGTITNRGSTGIVLYGLAATPSGSLFAVDGQGVTTNLYSVNPANGTLSIAGNPGVDFSTITGRGDGLLFGYALVDTDNDTFVDNSFLYSVNSNTPSSATFIGSLGLPISGGLVFDDNANLFATDVGGTLFTISTINGTLTEVGPTQPGLFGLSFSNGTLYGYSDSPRNVYQINRTTGAATPGPTYQFPTGDPASIIYAAADIPVAIPEPGTLAFLLPVAFAVCVARKRR